MISVVLESLRKGFLNNGRHRSIVKKVSCGSGDVDASCWDGGRDLVAVELAVNEGRNWRHRAVASP